MTGLIVVALLIALLLVSIALLLRPGGGFYISEKQANAIRAVHRRPRKGGDPPP